MHLNNSEHLKIAEKFKTGDYIILWKNVEPITLKYKWRINGSDRLFPGIDYKIIHKRHKEVLDEYLKDSSKHICIVIEDSVYRVNNFIETYDENHNYKIMNN